MDVDVTARRFRCFLLIFNTVVGHTGALLLAVGLWLRFDKTIDSYFKRSTATPFYATLDLPAAVRTAYAIFIAFGASIYFLAFSNCCVTFKRPRSLLGFDIAIITALLAGELGGGIYARVKLRDIVENIEVGIVNDLHINYKSQSSLLNNALISSAVAGMATGTSTSPLQCYRGRAARTRHRTSARTRLVRYLWFRTFMKDAEALLQTRSRTPERYSLV